VQEQLHPAVKKKRRSKQRKRRFTPRWVKLPRRWLEALRQSRSANTYRLALIVLFEAFRQEQIGGEIVLSKEITGISGSARARAVDELVRLELIKVRRNGRQAIRVINIRE
jgi:hypothetical protein